MNCASRDVGVSLNMLSGRVLIRMRQEGNLVQYDSVPSVGSNFCIVTLEVDFRDI